MKSYKLKKELPDTKAGATVCWDDISKEYYVETERKSRIYFQESSIGNVDWFYEIKEPVIEDKIEVLGMGYSHDNKHGWWYHIGTKKPLNPTDYPNIQKAVENALNPSREVLDGDNKKDWVGAFSIGDLNKIKNCLVKCHDFELASKVREMEKQIQQSPVREKPMGQWVDVRDLQCDSTSTPPPSTVEEKKVWETEMNIKVTADLQEAIINGVTYRTFLK